MRKGSRVSIENQQKGGRCLDDPRGKLKCLYGLAQDQFYGWNVTLVSILVPTSDHRHY